MRLMRAPARPRSENSALAAARIRSRVASPAERIGERVTTVTLPNQMVRSSVGFAKPSGSAMGANSTCPTARAGGRMTDFDYLVIGGGTSGCVLAERLSSDPRTRVLLLEAGQSEGPALMANPAAWPGLWGSAVDWADKTVPQDGSGGAVHAWPRGKVLGGSSGINGMIHLRAHRVELRPLGSVGRPRVGLSSAAAVSAQKRDRGGA